MRELRYERDYLEGMAMDDMENAIAFLNCGNKLRAVQYYGEAVAIVRLLNEYGYRLDRQERWGYFEDRLMNELGL